VYEMTASPVELPDGHIRVGNITIHPAKVLGKGCEGTFVYQVMSFAKHLSFLWVL
jgi:hypothetical protein